MLDEVEVYTCGVNKNNLGANKNNCFFLPQHIIRFWGKKKQHNTDIMNNSVKISSCYIQRWGITDQ